MIETFRIGSPDIEKRSGGNAGLDATGIEILNHDGVVITGKNGACKNPMPHSVAGLETIRQSRQR